MWLKLRGLFFTAALLALALLPLRAQEVQQHGLVFEQWVRDTFFEGFRPKSYTQKWDIPAAVNKTHGLVPVNPKATKFGTPVDLGDALRQIQISEPFMLIIGYWQQTGDTKRIVNIVAPTITPEQWQKLWAPVTLADLKKLDAVIKDRSLTPAQARDRAQAIKKAPPFSQSIIVVNPKIDSKGQRRLQCSLRFADLFKHLAPDADASVQEKPTLWGVDYPGPIDSKPRQFKGAPR